MIIKSFEVEGQISNLLKNNLFLIYGENNGLKKDIAEIIKNYFKKENSNIVTIIYPWHFMNDHNLSYFPLSGLSNRKTIHCNENGYYSIYQSDRYGFNNPDSEWDQQEIEYLLIGDSMTHGACVNRPNDIGSVLRKLSKKDMHKTKTASNKGQFSLKCEKLDIELS